MSQMPASMIHCPQPGSALEKQQFGELQANLAVMFERVFPNPNVARTVVVIPSFSLDAEELAKVSGIYHYEERMLCLLMLLQLPRTKVIYVTSQPIHPSIIDYYLHLLPGIPGLHARKRLTVLSCDDSSSLPLTEKILARPRLLQDIRDAIADPSSAHITCFNSTPLERTLAVQLNIPLYACDPALSHLGSKSGSREAFRQAGIDYPDGFENLRDEEQIFEALTELKMRHPDLRKAVIKLNEGFSGEGNAVFSYEGHPEKSALKAWIRRELPLRIRFEAPTENWVHFRHKFAQMEGIVECWIEGQNKRSPSVQCRINPLGEAVIVSTHDQVLGGPSGQVFLGCSFPADEAYRLEIQEAGLRVADVLKQNGAIGRLAIDFISVKSGEEWKHYAIEINLRKGGTTHPFLMLQFLTNGAYDPESGLFRLPTGQARYYYASDNLQNTAYKGLNPDDLIDISVCNGLHFHGATQQGVLFHLMGALSEFGKLGVVCIGESYEQTKQLYDKTVDTLNTEISR
ncbi:MAG: peptide ligase PGM1-related protein [Ardenticatenaceae bacterium]